MPRLNGDSPPLNAPVIGNDGRGVYNGSINSEEASTMKTDIGARIRSLRLQKSMTQEQLAQKLNLTPQAVSKWENGVGMPDIQLLPELSVLLGVTIDGLFSMTDDARFDRIKNMLEDVRFLPEAEFTQAERWLKEQREDKAARPRATLMLAQLYNKRADEYHELASPLAREALELNPEEKEAHNALFNAEKGVFQDWYWTNHHRLIDFYKAFVDAHPDDWRGYMWLIDLLIADGRTEEARACVQRMRKARDSWRCEMYLGQICRAEGDLPGAMAWFERMTEREPENWLVWADYADELAKLGRFREALENQLKAMPLRESPRYVDPEESAAQLYEILGDRESAARMRRRIMEIMREDWNVTEGEAVDVHRREIARLEAGEAE